jgi:Phage tail protein (Tail_P2_I)
MTYSNNYRFFKPDYHQALSYIVPKYLEYDDIDSFGQETDLNDLIINRYIALSNNISSVLDIDPIPGTIFSSINTLEGIAPYFVKQNELSNIDADIFEVRILNRVGTSVKFYKTEEEFKTYLLETLLPSIRLNAPTAYFRLTDTVEIAHRFLIENLSWIYFLNTEGPVANIYESIADLLVETIYKGKSISLLNCIKLLNEFLFKNSYTTYFPEVFLSSNTLYTSGTQQLDKLNTWAEVLFSDLYADKDNFYIRNKFEDFIQSETVNNNTLPSGPFSRLLRALSFAAFDIDNKTESLRTLTDIDNCPAEYLPLLANLIGWDLFGSNPERWRLQLRNAVQVYKKVGTKKSIQFALNSIFPKDLFSIESRIEELWESYVPFIIMYSLATESPYFRSLDSWTPSVAEFLNVSGYSSNSMEENIRLATDRLLYETYLQFPLAFNFPLKENGYSYRGRVYPIPPFEEYPYYVNVELTQDMINFISDRLACFGVRNDFALQVKDYLETNTIDTDEQIRTSSFLFFTSGHSEPPNIGSIIGNLNSNNFDYVPLWSGKSSHFKLTFDASEFDFTKLELTEDSSDALIIAARVVNSFSPAHAIPLINLQLSAIDYTNIESDNLPIISIEENEIVEKFNNISNFYSSGLNINSYKRGINPTGKVFGRKDFESLRSPLVLSATTATGLNRNSLRERSYNRLMQKGGYFDRTGFNSPVSFDPSASLSGITLGFIPSSLSFQTITNYNNLPEIYRECYSINSSASFYGYDVSNTLKVRGHVPLSSRDYFEDRGTLPDIMVLQHRLGEAKKLYTQKYFGSASLEELQWKDVYQSSANYVTEASGDFPASVNDFYNFEFGKDLHKLYKIYTSDYARHRLSEDLHYLPGANIFSHCFGPYAFNSYFDILDSRFVEDSALFGNNSLRYGGAVFSTSGSAYGTVIASSVSSMKVGPADFVNSSILSGFDLIQTSGSNVGNTFFFFKILEKTEKFQNLTNSYSRNLAALRYFDGFPRFRLRLNNQNFVGSEYPLSSNFLLPDCDYSVILSSTIADVAGRTLGGEPIGCWIHTEPEDGSMWSFGKDGTWVQHSQQVTKPEVFNSYSHYFNVPLIQRDKESKNPDGSYNFKCIELPTANSQGLTARIILSDSDFFKVEFDFNTSNNMVFPRNYHLAYGPLHRKNQKYVIEVFKRTPSRDNYLLIDSFELVNKTLNKMSKFLAVKGSCPELRVDLTKLELQHLFRFWNTISGKTHRIGLASRDSTETSAIMNSQGGSRLDYRIIPDWYSPSYFGSPLQNLIIQDLGLKV